MLSMASPPNVVFVAQAAPNVVAFARLKSSENGKFISTGGPSVGVAVLVGVGVNVGVNVGVRVGVFVGLGVGVFVLVGV